MFSNQRTEVPPARSRRSVVERPGSVRVVSRPVTDRLDAVLDHVAVAVPAWEPAERRWRDALGGGAVAWSESPAFRSRQLRFAGGGKLELLAPAGDQDGFVRRFLGRFDSAVHHCTLKVPDLRAAVAVVRAAGLDVVDVDATDPRWQEGFLRPSQVGGLVVQLAASTETDEAWAARIGHVPEPPAGDAAVLLGPLLRHPDLARAAALWRLLGAEVTAGPDGLPDALTCAWPDSPLTVAVVPGAVAGPVALRMVGTGDLPAHDAEGPAVRGRPFRPGGVVRAVSRTAEHTFCKANQSAIRLVAGLGVEGDAHLGETVQHRSRVARDPSQPNLRQVHLVHAELHEELRAAGFPVPAGAIGENVTTRGVDLLALPAGARLRVGSEAVVEVMGLRNPCHQLDRYQRGLTAALLDRDPRGRLIRKAGVMGVVRAGGAVRPGDAISVELPPPPHRPLEPV